jgi:uncharacterized membrane protein YebE (DUF533 family)
MFDANKILGTLMESGMARSGQSRLQRVAGGSHGGGSGLAGILGSLLGGAGSPQRPGGGSGFGGIGSLLGGGGVGSLLGGGGRSGGAMGLLGMLAGAAMQHFGSGSGGARQASAQPGLAEDAAPYGDDMATNEQDRAMLMIRAMVTAKADGEIDPQEQQKILGRLEEAGADPEAQAFVRDELARPADLQTIVSAVDSPHTAIEAYAASLFAIDVDTPAEAAYMRQLAQGLGLNPTLVQELHASLEVPKPH